MINLGITAMMELYSLVNLLEKRLARDAVAWMEGCVVAIGASAISHGAIPIGTCETGVYHQFLQTLAINALVASRCRVVSFAFREVDHLHVLNQCLKVTLKIVIFAS